jgi:thiamine kinase-like enzyme
MDHLFDEEELNILSEIKEIVTNEENQNLLKDFAKPEPNDDKLVFCHNDLN